MKLVNVNNSRTNTNKLAAVIQVKLHRGTNFLINKYIEILLPRKMGKLFVFK
jgi:hypothetical protein